MDLLACVSLAHAKKLITMYPIRIVPDYNLIYWLQEIDYENS
jgi:hypothetical protein